MASNIEQVFPHFAALSVGGSSASAGSTSSLATLEAALQQAGLGASDQGVAPQSFWSDLARTAASTVSSALPTIGTVVGGAFGGTTGAQIGGAAGNILGGIGQKLSTLENATDYDMQFLDGFLKSQVADMIKKLYQFVQQHSNLVECVPLVTQCVQLFSQGQYAKALSKGYEAYRCIQAKL